MHPSTRRLIEAAYAAIELPATSERHLARLLADQTGFSVSTCRRWVAGRSGAVGDLNERLHLVEQVEFDSSEVLPAYLADLGPDDQPRFVGPIDLVGQAEPIVDGVVAQSEPQWHASRYEGPCYRNDCRTPCGPGERWYRPYDGAAGEQCRAYCSNCRSQIELFYDLEVVLRTAAGVIASEDR